VLQEVPLLQEGLLRCQVQQHPHLLVLVCLLLLLLLLPP
jgi:hypothetical protein